MAWSREIVNVVVNIVGWSSGKLAQRHLFDNVRVACWHCPLNWPAEYLGSELKYNTSRNFYSDPKYSAWLLNYLFDTVLDGRNA